MAALTLGTEAWFFEPGAVHWQTMVFTVLTISQLAHVLAIRSERQSLFSQGLLSNGPLAGAVALTLGLQLAVLYVPVLNELFGTEPLAPWELVLAAAVSSLVFVAVEIEKWVKRVRGGSGSGAPPDDVGTWCRGPERAGLRVCRGH